MAHVLTIRPQTVYSSSVQLGVCVPHSCVRRSVNLRALGEVYLSSTCVRPWAMYSTAAVALRGPRAAKSTAFLRNSADLCTHPAVSIQSSLSCRPLFLPTLPSTMFAQ